MDASVYFKKEKQEAWFNLITGGALLVVGLVMSWLQLGVDRSDKAITGLSFIPLSIGIGALVRLAVTRKSPADLKAVVASLTDERLVAQRNEAEATANRWLRWLSRLLFWGYTFLFSQEVFVSAGWWVTCAIFILSYLLPLTLLAWNSRGGGAE